MWTLSGPITVCASMVALAVLPSVSTGQTPATRSQEARPPGSAASSLEATVEALGKTIELQQQLLEQQARQIEQLRREIAETRALATPAPPAVSPPAQLRPPEQSERVEPPLADQEQPRVPELPPDVVSVADFPGAFRMPGTDAALRISGLVRVNWVSSYDALLVDDRFQTSAIPVEGSPEASRGGRVNIIASPSRFNFDLRTPTGVGYMRAFIEGDSPGRAARCGFDTPTGNGAGSSSVRRGPRSPILKRNPTASTSRD